MIISIAELEIEEEFRLALQIIRNYIITCLLRYNVTQSEP